MEIENLMQRLDAQAEIALLSPTEWQQKQELRHEHLYILKCQEFIRDNDPVFSGSRKETWIPLSSIKSQILEGGEIQSLHSS